MCPDGNNVYLPPIGNPFDINYPGAVGPVGANVPAGDSIMIDINAGESFTVMQLRFTVAVDEAGVVSVEFEVEGGDNVVLNFNVSVLLQAK